MTSLDWNFVSKTWKKSWYIYIVSLEPNSSPKTKFEKVYLWNSLFFLENHGDESSGRFKMRLKKEIYCILIDFISFLYILGYFGNKVPGLGKHLTRLEIKYMTYPYAYSSFRKYFIACNFHSISPSTHLHDLQGKTMSFTSKLFQT